MYALEMMLEYIKASKLPRFQPHPKTTVKALTAIQSEVQITTYLLQLQSQNMLPVDKKSSVLSYMVTNSHCQHVQ